jgi:trans-aconitate 2-methyltransferase
MKLSTTEDAEDTALSDPWNPSQYGKFEREREQPFYDLLAMVRPTPDMRVVDLGCGTGKLTRELHTELHARETVGIDRSRRMLDQAGGTTSTPGLRFEVGDIESFPGGAADYDLVFSNAALHWVEDHEALFARLAAALNPHGQLAVQMPAMHDEVSHLVAAEVFATELYRAASGGWVKPEPVLSPGAYARLMFRLRFRDPVVRLIVYPHVLSGPDEVVEWVKGTLLAEYSRHLPPEVFQRFLADYRERLLAQLGDERPFLFPFKLILLWGQRA